VGHRLEILPRAPETIDPTLKKGIGLLRISFRVRRPIAPTKVYEGNMAYIGSRWWKGRDGAIFTYVRVMLGLRQAGERVCLMPQSNGVTGESLVRWGMRWLTRGPVGVAPSSLVVAERIGDVVCVTRDRDKSISCRAAIRLCPSPTLARPGVFRYGRFATDWRFAIWSGQDRICWFWGYAHGLESKNAAA